MPASITEKPASVRIAGAADEAALFDLFMAAHADNALFAVNPDKVREWVRIFACHPEGMVRGHVGVIDGADGVLAAGCALILDQPWYTDSWCITDKMVFVHPEYRQGHNYGRDLLQFSKFYADTIGLPLTIGILSTKRPGTKDRFYRRYLQPAGATFVHGAARADGPLSRVGAHV